MELQFVCVVLHKGAIKSNGVWLSALQLFVAMRRVHVICTLTRVIYGNSPRCERDRHYIWARWRSTLLLCATTNEWQCLFSIYTDRPNTECHIWKSKCIALPSSHLLRNHVEWAWIGDIFSADQQCPVADEIARTHQTQKERNSMIQYSHELIPTVQQFH